MNLKPQDLSPELRHALRERRFGDERPEEGVVVNLRVAGPFSNFGPAKLFGETWTSTNCHSIDDVEDDFHTCPAAPGDTWKPLASLDTSAEAPKAEKRLPDPGQYFWIGDRLARRATTGGWALVANAQGMSIDPVWKFEKELPDSWAPLNQPQPDDRDARIAELEDELNQEQCARRAWERSATADAATVKELLSEIDGYIDRIRSLEDKADDRDARIKELQAEVHDLIEVAKGCHQTTKERDALIAKLSQQIKELAKLVDDRDARIKQQDAGIDIQLADRDKLEAEIKELEAQLVKERVEFDELDERHGVLINQINAARTALGGFEMSSEREGESEV